MTWPRPHSRSSGRSWINLVWNLYFPSGPSPRDPETQEELLSSRFPPANPEGLGGGRPETLLTARLLWLARHQMPEGTGAWEPRLPPGSLTWPGSHGLGFVAG